MAIAERAIEVGVAQERQHVVLEDRLALGFRQEGGLETGRGVELDLAVLEADGSMSKKMTIPSLKPFAPDTPLVDERAGLDSVSSVVRPYVTALRVHHDLGARPCLDRVDGRFGLDDRLGRQDPRRSRRPRGRSRVRERRTRRRASRRARIARAGVAAAVADTTRPRAVSTALSGSTSISRRVMSVGDQSARELGRIM